jgi:hypothetical protein
MNTYIIMANGRGSRWGNFTDRPKHLIQVDGESLLERSVRLLKMADPWCRIIITSSDSRYEVSGATRHVPQENRLEIDRFTQELIQENTCFLYGDTYYTEQALRKIVQTAADSLLFFGNQQRILAVKVKNPELMRQHLQRVKELYLAGQISDCKGWQLYQSLEGLPFGQKQLAGNFVYIADETRDFNFPDDYLNFLAKREELTS